MLRLNIQLSITSFHPILAYNNREQSDEGTPAQDLLSLKTNP